jgi:hypothetical protein
MISMGVSEGPKGLKRRDFECIRCGRTESDGVEPDPLNKGVGWLSGELGRDAVAHEIREGRLVRKARPNK